MDIPSLHLLLANLKHVTFSEHQGPNQYYKDHHHPYPPPTFSNSRETSTPENECEHCCDAGWNSETSNVLLASTLKSSMGANTTDLIQSKTIIYNEIQQKGYSEIQCRDSV
jgi:hypothetical protein